MLSVFLCWFLPACEHKRLISGERLQVCGHQKGLSQATTADLMADYTAKHILVSGGRGNSLTVNKSKCFNLFF